MLEEDLSNGEKLYLFRKRIKELPHVTAKRYNVQSITYRQWEKDERKGPDINIGGMFPREVYTILRLRAGDTMVDLGHRMGKDEKEIRRMEAGETSLRPLREFWGI